MKKILFSILLYFSILFCNIYAQDSIFARKIIEKLSSAEMFGRGYSYNGDGIAANFIRNECKKLNMEALCDNYYQQLSYPAFKMEGNCYIKINDKELIPGKDYYIESFSCSIDNNKIPVIYTSLESIAKPDVLNSFLRKHRKKITKSIIYIETKNNSEISAEEKKFLHTLKKHNPFKSLGIIIGEKQLPMKSLSSHPKDNNYALIHSIDSLFAEKPKHISISFSNEAIIHTTQNVCAYIRGTEVADSFIVLCAHYDHLGSIGNKTYYPGAHDNASGVAALIDIANYFSKKPHKYSIAFLFFCGEEAGLIGSGYFVKHPLIPLDKIKALINIDMFCGGNEGIMIVNAKSDKTQPIYNSINNINTKHNYISQIKTRPNAANSDHYFFSTHCPSIFIYTMGGNYGGYHDIYDTCESCGLENYENLIRLIIESIETF